MKKLRIGVVGLGDISRVYLDNLKKYSDYVTIEACASRTLEKAQKKAGLDYNGYGYRFAVLHYYSCVAYNRLDYDVFGKLPGCIL